MALCARSVECAACLMQHIAGAQRQVRAASEVRVRGNQGLRHRLGRFSDRPERQPEACVRVHPAIQLRRLLCATGPRA
eukprot:12481774-Alexandrium_andersonii.AAC.1